MARLEAVVSVEVKQMLIEIAKADNRSLTNELVTLIIDRYKKLKL